jgi:hypothetical protein
VRNQTTRSCSACTGAASRGRRTVPFAAVSLRGRTIQENATLPDGRSVAVHVGVPEDPYIPRSQMETVDVELHSGGTVLAAVNTVLDPDQEGEALELAREIARGLESGTLAPTASSIEPLADTLR